MIYRKSITIPVDELKEMEAILATSEGSHPDYGSADVIETYSAIFENGVVADIKVCNGDTPYVDNVLFAPDKTNPCYLSEVDVPEIAETLEGEYHFEYAGDQYIVDVLPERRITMPYLYHMVLLNDPNIEYDLDAETLEEARSEALDRLGYAITITSLPKES
jgi:hypothetical protein